MKSWKCGDALLEYFWVWLGSSFDLLVCSLIHRATWGIWIWFSPIYGVYTAKLFLITAFWTGVLVCPAWYIGNDGCGCALVWLSKIHSFESFWTFTPLSEFWVRKTLWWRLPTREMRFLVSPCLEKLILFIHVTMDKLKSCFSRQGKTRITHFSGRKPSSQCFSDPEYTLVLRTKLRQTGRNHLMNRRT